MALSVTLPDIPGSGVDPRIYTIEDLEAYLRTWLQLLTAQFGDLAEKDSIATADIDNSAVTLAKLASLSGGRIIGRASGTGSGAPIALSAADIKTILALAAGDISGLGSLATQSQITLGDIPDALITNAKVSVNTLQSDRLVQIAQGSILGRAMGAGLGNVTELAGADIAAILAGLIGAAQIADGAITNAKVGLNTLQANRLVQIAAGSILGRASGAGLGNVTELSAADIRTIINVSDGATANQTDAFLRDLANATGMLAAARIPDDLIKNRMIGQNQIQADRLVQIAAGSILGRAMGAGVGDVTELSATDLRTILNVADGATANQTDAFLRDLANATGTLDLSKLADLADAQILGRASGAGPGAPIALSAADMKNILSLAVGDTNGLTRALDKTALEIDPRAFDGGYLYSVVVNGKRVMAIDTDGSLETRGIDMGSQTAEQKRTLGENSDFSVDVGGVSVFGFRDGEMFIGPHTVYVEDQRLTGLPYVFGYSANGGGVSLALMPDDTWQINQTIVPYSDFSSTLQASNLRRHFSDVEYVLATVSERGQTFEARKNVTGAATTAPVIQSPSPMWGRIGYGQSTMGQSGNDGDVLPFGGAYFPASVLEPSQEQAYGSEASLGDGVATILPGNLFELQPASDAGWNENYPMTLLGWSVEHLWRHFTGQATPGQVSATCWEGGQLIASFRDGTSNFANVEVYLSKWADIVEAHARTAETPLLHWTQGEGGGATYQSDCAALFAEIDAAWIAAGFSAPDKIAMQVNIADDLQFEPESRQAIVNIARSGGCILAGPMYAQHLHDDGIHPDQHGDIVGANISALAEYRLRAGLNTDPVWITNVAVAGSTGILTYNLPPLTTAIEIDDAYLPTVPNAGFEASDGSGALTITGVAVTATNQITLTFDRAVSGTLTVTYASATMDNTTTGWANGIGNVRAACTVPAFLGGQTFNDIVTPEFVLQPAVAETVTS